MFLIFTQHFCVVCPSSLVCNWDKEFDRWLGKQGQPKRVTLLKGDTTFKSSSMKSFLHSKVGQVVIMSYDLFRVHSHHFADHHQKPHDHHHRVGVRFGLLVVDEGHRLKSASGSLTLSSLERLPVDARLLLSATPLQNNLAEFYALANFCRPGALGRDLGEFRRRFEHPILRHRSGGSNDPTPCPARLELDRIVSTFMLRRHQQDVLKSMVPPRTEMLLFCRPSSRQSELYEEIVDSATSTSSISFRSSSVCSTDILSALTSLRKVCSHPILVQRNVNDKKDLNVGTVSCPRENPSENAVHSSGKLVVLQGLLRSMADANGRGDCSLSPSPNKVVIVSSFTSTLSLVETLVLKPAGYTYVRLDGSTTMEERQSRVDAFNKQPRIFCFLLSSKAGGWYVYLIEVRNELGFHKKHFNNFIPP
jgi:SNF2 family DNA or RNA helicase